MASSDDLATQINDILQEYGVYVDEVACSTAMFLLSVKNGQEVTQRVGKWFHPDEHERYFSYQITPNTKDYFAVILLEGSTQVQTVSFGVINHNKQCYDVWSFQEKFPSISKRVQSSPGYIIEIACIDTDKPTSLSDFSDAKHIEAKYLQRMKNHTHYYPNRTKSANEYDFLMIQNQVSSPRDDIWVYEKAQQELQEKQHPWDLLDGIDDSELASAFGRYLCGAREIKLSSIKSLNAISPLPCTNIWGCLLYDIAAQSLTSASIPRTRLYIPWLTTVNNEQSLTLKMVV